MNGKIAENVIIKVFVMKGVIKMGMRIDDEVYVHGYLDEIRQDKVIIRNEGGYFGTVIGELIEAIPKAEYEARLKADLVAMLTEIQLEIEEHEESIIGHYGKETKESNFPSHKIERNNGRKECVNLIQQKIAKLKG